VCGLGAGWVPGVLALFGAGAFAGVTAAGRLADRGGRPVLPAVGAALLAGWAALALAAGRSGVAVALVPVLGLLAFGVGSTLVVRVLYEAVDAPSLGGAFATSALNVGAALGPVLGGAALDGGLGHRSPVWVSALLMAAAGLVARRRAHRPEEPA
jgi:DHA1 family chloramphenicol resistance protein-like MFS transporter